MSHWEVFEGRSHSEDDLTAGGSGRRPGTVRRPPPSPLHRLRGHREEERPARAREVQREVQFLYDTYARPDGRFLFTAGNGINGDCPLASLEALYDEAYVYGSNIAPNAPTASRSRPAAPGRP